MKEGIIKYLNDYYKSISTYIWTIVFSFLSLIIIMPSLLDILVPGTTDKIFNTRWVYLIFFLFFIDITLLLSSIDKKINQIKVGGIVYLNQSDAITDVLQQIKNKKYKNVKMIEASFKTARPILNALLDNDCSDINILLQHPDYAVEPEQKKRIKYVLKHEKSLWTDPRLIVRLYKFETTVRGRLFDNELLNFGWFAPSRNDLGENDSAGMLIGHTNPMLYVDKSTKDGIILIEHFKNIYDTLFSDDLSITVQKYYEIEANSNL